MAEYIARFSMMSNTQAKKLLGTSEAVFGIKCETKSFDGDIHVYAFDRDKNTCELPFSAIGYFRNRGIMLEKIS